MTRKWRIVSALAIILAGLLLRFIGPHAGVPLVIVKYGGSALWAMMLYYLLTIATPLETSKAALLSVILAIGVELFRLVHFDWLDNFRLTLTGALLLGRIFSTADIGVYVLGIVFMLAADNALDRKLKRRRAKRDDAPRSSAQRY